MSTYVVADLTWTDPAARAEYGKHAREALAKYGGRYLVAGGGPRSLEGGWQPSVISVIEFPTPEDARRWYESDEYRPLKALRAAGAETRAILAEGVATMGTSTRSVVETFFQRLATGEPEELTALLAEDVDWDIPGSTAVAPWVGPRDSRAGVADYLRRLRASVEPIHAEVQHILVDGEVAIASGAFASRMVQTGKVVESIFFAQFLVRDGLIVRYRLLEDSQAVVEALTA
jgi:uncharacterized protein (DUF1330 family)/ketosteroid isomerase-like protein